LWLCGIFCGNLVYFVAIWYFLWLFGIVCAIRYILGLFGIFSPVFVCCTNKNLATLSWIRNQNVHM
jgi:hypothetical protein